MSMLGGRLHRRRALGLAAGGTLLGLIGGGRTRALAQVEAELYQPAESFEIELHTGYVVQDDEREREIPVAVRYPVGLTEPAAVVVFSHGGGPQRSTFVGNPEWGETLARAGYVVVHVTHTLSDAERERVCGELDVTDECDDKLVLAALRPDDASAVIAALPEIVAEYPRLGPFVDLDRIGMAGWSAGSYTTLALAGAIADVGQGPIDNSDPTPKAFLALSPQGPGKHGFTEDSWDEIERPVMVVTGAGDTHDLDPLNRRVPYEQMPPGDKMLVWLDDQASTHDTFNLDNEDEPELVAWVRAAGLAWLDATLREREEALAWLESGALTEVSDGVVELEMK